jgi:hypothetical protein
VNERIEIKLRAWPPFRDIILKSLWMDPLLTGFFVLIWGVQEGLIVAAITIVGTAALTFLTVRFRFYLVLHDTWLDLLDNSGRWRNVMYRSVDISEADSHGGGLTIRWESPKKGGYGWAKRSTSLWPRDPKAALAEIRRRVEVAKAVDVAISV